MKRALVVVSFGTSVAQARQSITAVEAVLQAAAPDRDFYRAFTSPTIRRILARRGETILSLPELLEQLSRDGYGDVVVQPTHFLYGIEYDRLRAAVAEYAPRFSTLTLGKPLLSGTADLKAMAQVLVETFRQVRCPLVLLGHGTDHYANLTYPAMETALRLAGRKDAYVGTVEGWPGFAEVLSGLQRDARREVLLVPMMLVAGDHALHDMAGADGDSWKSRLEAQGFSVHCHMSGMGMLPGVQALYRAHLEEII